MSCNMWLHTLRAHGFCSCHVYSHPACCLSHAQTARPLHLVQEGVPLDADGFTTLHNVVLAMKLQRAAESV